MTAHITTAAVTLATTLALAALPQPARDRQPLEVARTRAARYPEDVSMRYISALVWSGALRLSDLSGEAR